MGRAGKRSKRENPRTHALHRLRCGYSSDSSQQWPNSLLSLHVQNFAHPLKTERPRVHKARGARNLTGRRTRILVRPNLAVQQITTRSAFSGAGYWMRAEESMKGQPCTGGCGKMRSLLFSDSPTQCLCYEYFTAHTRKGANILKRTIEYMCQGPFDSDREDALTILNQAIEECFAAE